MDADRAAIGLIFNPGSASLKFELIETRPRQALASDGRKLLSASIEGIGKEAQLLVFRGREIACKESCEAPDVFTAAAAALNWLRRREHDGPAQISEIAFVGLRVVHGGEHYTRATRFTPAVRRDIEALQEFAPLHNRSSLAVLSLLESELRDVPVLLAFDTAFHRTLPEIAWRYPLDRATADRYGVRKFGFHGLSHRWMLEQYARQEGKSGAEVSLITLHLESGCSATAICKGKSIDTTMGLTPLEGLMMGTRSGSIDPAIVPILMRKMNADADQIMHLLNKQSGLLGIAGETFDTRELVKRDDDSARLALAMFAYRARLAVGAYLTVVPEAEALIFGGGIGEDTPLVRKQICDGLRGWGLELDEESNARATFGPACITRPNSRLPAFVIPVEEGLQIAHECQEAMEAQ
jgi:acetate kinase